MRFTPLELPGAFLIDIEPIEDTRGFFARTWCARELAEHGLDGAIVQTSLSENRRRGTLRGMHFQVAPHQETKVVGCLHGSIHDVIVDLRPESPTYARWVGIELSASSRRRLYVPKGFAHGFQTLEDDTLVTYQMSEFYHPESGRGVRWDDPALAIRWPLAPTVIVDRDQGFPPFSAQR